jgi:hypothetical protein
MLKRVPEAFSGCRGIPVPVMLQMLALLEQETNRDVVLAGVSRTLAQAIDELTVLQKTAMDVMREAQEDLADDARSFRQRRLLC